VPYSYGPTDTDPIYEFVITDLAGGELSEATTGAQRTVTLAIDAPTTAGVTVRRADYAAAAILTGDTKLKVYSVHTADGVTHRVLLAHLRQLGWSRTGQDGKTTVAATYTDPMGYLAHRVLPPGSNPSVGLAGALAFLIALAPGRYAALDVGVIDTATVGWDTGWKDVASSVADLVAAAGFQWRVRPDEGYLLPASSAIGGAQPLVIGILDAGVNLGLTLADIAWEYGDGLGNVLSYTHTGDLTTMGNRIIADSSQGAAASASPTSGGQSISLDTAAQAAHDYWDALVATDITNPFVRALLAAYHLAIRKQPREQVPFQPRPRLGGGWVLGTDFNVGDVMPFAAYDDDETPGGDPDIEVSLRCYAATITPDDASGVVTPTLSFTADTGT
jgi:hypothetical protein